MRGIMMCINATYSTVNFPHFHCTLSGKKERSWDKLNRDKQNLDELLFLSFGSLLDYKTSPVHYKLLYKHYQLTEIHCTAVSCRKALGSTRRHHPVQYVSGHDYTYKRTWPLLLDNICDPPWENQAYCADHRFWVKATITNYDLWTTDPANLKHVWSL